jgi:hypothetical protein
VIDHAPSDDDRGEEFHDDGGEDDVERPARPRTGCDDCGAEPEVQADDEHAGGDQGDCPVAGYAPPTG